MGTGMGIDVGIEETKYQQEDFSGGLNINPRIAENEMQEATNVDIEDFGVLRPALADTLIKAVSNVICHQVLDGFIYYLVGTTLSRCTTAGASTTALGTIGGSYFKAENWGGVHIIIATDKVYEVIGGTLYDLGVTTPTATPTVAYVGAGALTGTYYCSFTYVKKFTLADGSEYEEESPLSPEVTATPVAQDITVNGMTASTEAGVSHKRIYIRGGALTNRYRAGEVTNATTSFTIDQTEAQLVLLTIEDIDDNDKISGTPVHGGLVDGRLFVVIGKTVVWSRALIPSAFPVANSTTFETAPLAIYQMASNLAVLLAALEEIYVNPGASPANGGYIHYPSDPQGCISTRSAVKGYHASDEGMSYLRSSAPVIFTRKIRSELLGLTGRADTIGAYLRGKYYACIPSQSIMYEYLAAENRFLKYDSITDVAAGDDGELYVVKSAGIYKFASETTRKSFAYRSPEIYLPEDRGFERVAIECNFGSDGGTIEYYVNGSVVTTKTVTTSGREMVYTPINMEAGSRVSVRISNSSAISETDYGIYGVYLR
jgi:hypothetical protein